MEILFVLVPIAVALAGIGLVAFIWAVRSGEYDDLETPAHAILLDDLGPEDEDRRS